MENKQIGPMRFESFHCGLCIYHKSALWKSGLHPIYHHFCEHPDNESYERETITYGMQAIRGKRIGDSDHTPGWCPARNNV